MSEINSGSQVGGSSSSLSVSSHSSNSSAAEARIRYLELQLKQKDDDIKAQQKKYITLKKQYRHSDSTSFAGNV